MFFLICISIINNLHLNKKYKGLTTKNVTKTKVLLKYLYECFTFFTYNTLCKVEFCTVLVNIEYRNIKILATIEKIKLVSMSSI